MNQLEVGWNDMPYLRDNMPSEQGLQYLFLKTITQNYYHQKEKKQTNIHVIGYLYRTYN
jgi:hypothetical protein